MERSRQRTPGVSKGFGLFSSQLGDDEAGRHTAVTPQLRATSPSPCLASTASAAAAELAPLLQG